MKHWETKSYNALVRAHSNLLNIFDTAYEVTAKSIENAYDAVVDASIDFTCNNICECLPAFNACEHELEHEYALIIVRLRHDEGYTDELKRAREIANKMFNI